MSVARRRIRLWSAVAAAVVALAAAGLALAARTPGEDGTFPMNHSVHIKGKVDCLQCHLGVMDTSEERFPSIGVCTGCHKDPPGINKNKILLASYVSEKKPLRWDPPHNLPDHVFFPHDRHVDVAGLECAQCHPEKATETAPRTSVPKWSMSRCIACHEKSKSPAAQRASLDCASCHR